MFVLDQRLATTSAPLMTLPLSEARLQLDSRFPWVILVPRCVGARELEDLTPEQLHTLTQEILLVSRALRRASSATGTAVDKINVAALGNVVPQLHVHVVGRRTSDEAWPAPVWGYGVAKPYAADELIKTTRAVCDDLMIQCKAL